jgi:hypothetical protein
MARHEADREDLLAETAALLPRAQLDIPGLAEPVVVGFRPRLSGWSFYFTQDCAYHFDSQGRLRRAFVDGALLRAQQSTLARLVRDRSPEETVLRRTDLSPEELQAVLREMRARLETCRRALEAGRVVVRRSFGDSTALVLRLRGIIEAILGVDPPLSEPLKRDR